MNIKLPIVFQVAAYDKTQNKMAFFDPSRAQDFVFISGTKVSFSFFIEKNESSMPSESHPHS